MRPRVACCVGHDRLALRCEGSSDGSLKIPDTNANCSAKRRPAGGHGWRWAGSGSLTQLILLDAVRLCIARPDRDLFRDVTMTVTMGDKIGLVGINGTGKTTLLRVLAGQLEPDSGEVRRGRGVRVTVLDQAGTLPSGPVIDAVATSIDDRWEAEAVLDKLGMGTRFDQPVDSLSGGEARRVALARALVQPSELLILDEPTNHLDLDAIDWLVDRLQQATSGLLLVTHDRHLLDAVTNRMVELDRGSVYVHNGTYADYLAAKTDRESAAATAEAVRRNLARSELAWLRRGAPARTSKPKAHIARAKEIIETRPEGPARAGDLHLEFPTPRLGDVVIETQGLRLETPDGRLLVKGLDIALDPRERLGIVGPNGVGKTTLLNALAGGCQPAAGDYRPAAGEVTVGSTVRLGYYRQTTDELDPNARARDVVAGPHREADWTDARLLEAFWFDTDTQWAPVHTLSGGERRRLLLLQILGQRPNVLFLDEPTNDLDLETLRALEDFLDEWPGAVVVVSHDRAFLERVVADALVMDGDGFAGRWPGGFGAWDSERRTRRGKRDSVAGRVGPSEQPALQKAKPSGGTQRATSGAGAKSSKRSSSTLGHLMRENEKAMRRLEKTKVDLEAKLQEAGADHQQLADLGQELGDVVGELTRLEDEWLELADEQQNR